MADKNIVLTGASSGFGKLATELLIAQGHTVVAGLRGGEERAQAVFGPAELDSGRLVAVDVHMERPETFDVVVKVVEERFAGRLDVLINNAGYAVIAAAEDLTEEQVRHQMDVNFVGPFLLTNRLLPAIREGRGRIVNVSSVLGFASFALYGVYAASKHALEGYSEGLAAELAPFGVQVCIVEPGGFDTRFAATASETTALVPASSPYGPKASALTRFFRERASALSDDPLKVAKLLARLAVRPKIPLRVRVGKDAHLMAALKWLLPDRLRLWLVTRSWDRMMS